MRFFGVTSLVRQLLESREDRRLERLLSQLSRQDLLILDELGYVPFTKTGAMLDRLTHRVHIVEANGESYRLRDSQRRMRRKRRTTSKN